VRFVHNSVPIHDILSENTSRFKPILSSFVVDSQIRLLQILTAKQISTSLFFSLDVSFVAFALVSCIQPFLNLRCKVIMSAFLLISNFFLSYNGFFHSVIHFYELLSSHILDIDFNCGESSKFFLFLRLSRDVVLPCSFFTSWVLIVEVFVFFLNFCLSHELTDVLDGFHQRVDTLLSSCSFWALGIGPYKVS
jgi:hypothetical protein